MKNLGMRIRHQRRTAGLTQARLAEMVNVQPETISRIENGHVDPSRGLLARMARPLGVTLGQLTRWETGESAKDAEIERLVAWASRLTGAEVRLVLAVGTAMIAEVRAEARRGHQA